MPSLPSPAQQLLTATSELCAELAPLTFAEPVSYVYNPLLYAKTAHELYLTRFGDSHKRVLMLGMNPGPWGMSQTGVPFGEIPAVRDWLGIDVAVQKPNPEHPKRPVEGFACTRSEVSGRRLWGLFSERYPKPEDFFAEHFVVNFCPLVFMEEGGRNRTPDKLPKAESAPLTAACDRYLQACISALQPEYLIGVGGFAEKCLERALKARSDDDRECDHHSPMILGRVLHPSPASPAANRGWSEAATQQLVEQGVWSA